MHKPSSVRSLSIPFRPYQLLSLPPYPPTRSLQLPPPPPPSVLVALGRLFLFPLSTLAPFSYPLILSQPFSLRKRRSAIHLFPLPFSFYPFHFPSLCFSLFLSILFYPLFEDASFPCQCSLLLPSLQDQRKSLCSRLLFYHSIPWSSITHCALFLEEQLLDFRLFNPLN